MEFCLVFTSLSIVKSNFVAFSTIGVCCYEVFNDLFPCSLYNVVLRGFVSDRTVRVVMRCVLF